MRAAVWCVALAILTACATSPSPASQAEAVTPGEGPCSRDADCVVTTFSSCCSSCPSAPRAMPASELKKREDICAVVDCARLQEEKCPPEVPIGNRRAICRGGSCAVSAAGP